MSEIKKKLSTENEIKEKHKLDYSFFWLFKLGQKEIGQHPVKKYMLICNEILNWPLYKF